MLQNAPEHSAILSAFIKLKFVIKTFVLSIFEWPFKTGFTVLCYNTYLSLAQTLKQPMSTSAAFSILSPGFPLPLFTA